MLSSAQKQEKLKLLAKKRQQARIDGYCCLHEIADGIYECEYVSPWSKSAHNGDASVMIVGQDWASRDRLEDQRNRAAIDDRIKRGYDARISSNINLHDLLHRHFGMAFADVYATNAFPFIKLGGMQASIHRLQMRHAVEHFLLPQIKIIQPRVVICLGLSTFNAVREACGHKRVPRLDDAVKAPFDFYSSKVVALAHTGARGTNNRGRDLVEGGLGVHSTMVQ